jgi:hypothetical protein
MKVMKAVMGMKAGQRLGIGISSHPSMTSALHVLHVALL